MLPLAGPGRGRLFPLSSAEINKSGLGPGCCSPRHHRRDRAVELRATRQRKLLGIVNPNAGIFNRTTGTLIASGTLDQLAGISSTIESFDVQVIWDPTTNRFYYTMDSIFSSTDNRLSFGFSKTSAPSNVTTDWCHYTLAFGTRFPDYPKLGDSQFFAIIGVNSFNPGFVGSDLIAISKPAAGTACPAASTFKVGEKLNLVNSSGAEVFTPVPANQVDTAATGFVVARNGALPATKLWFFNVTKGGTGFPVFGAARGVTVGSYAVPAAASQPVFTQVLDTLDGRNTQAVQATDPRLSNKFAFWTQHTIGSGTVSAVRWYEIDPVPATPVVLRSANITSTCFLYNAAISPDRRVNGATSAFGNNFVIKYNQSATCAASIHRILAASSVNGGAVSFLVVKPQSGLTGTSNVYTRRQHVPLGRLLDGEPRSEADHHGQRRGLGHKPVLRRGVPAAG